jgi:hypothetical protein
MMITYIFAVTDFNSRVSCGIPISKGWPMNDGKTVFAQLFEHVPINDFRKAVRRYPGEDKVQPTGR